jgi:hypothetical protein
MPFVWVFALGLLLQAGFVLLDCKKAPYQAATAFAHAYFSLEPAMAGYLWKGDAAAQQATIVSSFIELSKADTVKRGYNLSMVKNTLYHVRTNTVQKSDREAEVRLTAYRRTAINPAFVFIAKFFDLGKTYHVEETIRMIKEDGRWKVCSPVFDLAADS